MPIFGRNDDSLADFFATGVLNVLWLLVVVKAFLFDFSAQCVYCSYCAFLLILYEVPDAPLKADTQ